MLKKTEILNYWNKRFDNNGALSTGYTDELIQKFDDNKRWKVFKKSIEFCEGEKILDVGCNHGPWSIRLAKKKMNVTGIDIIEDAIKMAKENAKKLSLDIKFYKMNVEQSNFKDKKFDKIISITVLQHILNDITFSKALKNICRQLKFNGKLILIESAPNQEMPEKLPFKRERTFYEQIRVFEKFGLKLIKVKGIFNFSVKWYYWIKKFSLPIKLESFLQKIGVIILNQFDYFLSDFSVFSSHSKLKLMVLKKIK